MGCVNYSFASQLKDGKKGEAAIRRHLESKRWQVRATSYQGQKRGIDFYGLPPGGRSPLAIEVKRDEWVARTGNLFIETASVIKQGRIIRLGWGYTCQADFLIVYVPQWNNAWVISMKWVKENLPQWMKRYPSKNTRPTTDKGEAYHSRGVCIPTSVFDKAENRVCKKFCLIR